MNIINKQLLFDSLDTLNLMSSICMFSLENSGDDYRLRIESDSYINGFENVTLWKSIEDMFIDIVNRSKLLEKCYVPKCSKCGKPLDQVLDVNCPNCGAGD